MLSEKKGTCCHKCGHVHVKGTKCPTPYLKGKRSCARRSLEEKVKRFQNLITAAYFGKTLKKELHTMDHHAHDEHHQVRADIEEMSLGEPGVAPFIKFLTTNPEHLKAFVKEFGFPTENTPEATLKHIVSYLDDIKYTGPEWKEFLAWLTTNHPDWETSQENETMDEINEYCTACLAEYLLEYEHKIEEAEYRGRKVQLGKPFLTPGGPKKRSVYVKNAKGNVVKVNFGDPNLKIKKNIPARRKSFRARHKCDNPGPRWKARYWSCKAW